MRAGKTEQGGEDRGQYKEQRQDPAHQSRYCGDGPLSATSHRVVGSAVVIKSMVRAGVGAV
ncbi:hypothetical protein CGZ69_35760 [Streptomyces peucetius subsp. caesius ATCC 27952]|nr:hypothetical protein CGZ69_35760 [Streptomyces peucetius subsp. caesius ATCC 27952]